MTLLLFDWLWVEDETPPHQMTITKNPLEELLYPSSSGFAHLKETSNRQNKQHPYVHGLYLSINHNCKTDSEIKRQYDRIYRIVFSTLTGQVLIPSEVKTTPSLPREKVIKRLLKRNIPVMTSSVSKYSYEKKYSDGQKRTGFYYHSHHHFYRIHNLLPKGGVELIDKLEELKVHIQQYIPSTNQKYQLVKIQPCGHGTNVNDRITDQTYYQYLKTDPTSDTKNLLSYFINKSPIQTDTSLRFTFTE